MSDESTIRHLPYDDDLLDRLAKTLLARHPDQPVDLGACVVLFPMAGTRHRFRRKLLDVAQSLHIDALIPPDTASMKSWLEQFQPAETKILNHNEQELLLLQALAHYPHYLERYGTWPLIDSLLSLFEELTLNDCNISDDENHFRQSIESAYGIAELAPLADEAKLVHTLWTAWRTECQQQGVMDGATAHVAALKTSITTLSPNTHIWLAGFRNLAVAEQQWIHALEERGQIDILAHGEPDPLTTRPEPDSDIKTVNKGSAEYSNFFAEVFASADEPLLKRVRRQKNRSPESPVASHVQILEARGLEQEARAIDIQVRRWLLQGKNNIGVVTNDRRLARRVRALLERAKLVLVDSAGWTLSTTSAASVIMRWIDCIETNFHFQSLLDFLRSPFYTHGGERKQLYQIVGHFEEHIIYRAGNTADLSRYLSTIERKRKDIDKNAGEGTSSAMIDLLSRLKSAAQAFHGMDSSTDKSAETWFNALHSSLAQLGLLETLASDDAGADVIEEIDTLVRCVAGTQHSIDWQTFRTWLARNFERKKFKPAMTGGGVELMGFAESRLYQFDALVIGGATREHLPGNVTGSPFFNENVRTQLNLPSGFLPQRERMADFRHLLEAAPEILLSFATENNGRPVPASPWLQRLQAFHQLTYGSRLEASELLALTHLPQTLLASDNQPLPAPAPAPAVSAVADLLPQTLSASSYQRLIDCPFRFFAGDKLALREPEEVSDELEKRHYGARVHKILQAFHSGADNLPGPFGKPLTNENMADATALLSSIAESAFAHDIELHPTARGWLNLWQRIIPTYLTWQRQREQHCSNIETELTLSKPVLAGNNLGISGRIDRLDRCDGDLSLIDYKTGRAPRKAWIFSGESVQLVFYALLTEQLPAEVIALQLNDEGVSDSISFRGDELAELVEQENVRLPEIMGDLIDGAPMPAWGDTETCDRCEFDGLCRQEFWVNQR